MIGPILTTGVVLATAAVVAANPVMASRGDVQIRPVDLSSVPADMFDRDFLKAIAPASSGSAGPLGVLKDLVNALAADAAHLGLGTQASPAEAGASDYVSLPELADLAGIAPAVPAAPAAPHVGVNPVVTQALTAIVNDTRTSGGLTAIDTGVSPTAGEEALSSAAHDLVSVGIPRTLDTVASVVSSVPLAPTVIADSISALGQHLASLPAAGSVPNSSTAGDTPDSVVAAAIGKLEQALRSPTGPPPLASSPGSGDVGATGPTSPTGPATSTAHRPWRPGTDQPASPRPRFGGLSGASPLHRDTGQ